MKIKVSEDGKLIVNRMQMIEVRQMDHNQLNAFLTGIYRQGKENGMAAGVLEGRSEALKTKERAWNAFVKAIQEVKGVGETRQQELRLAFRSHFSSQEGDQE